MTSLSVKFDKLRQRLSPDRNKKRLSPERKMPLPVENLEIKETPKMPTVSPAACHNNHPELIKHHNSYPHPMFTSLNPAYASYSTAPTMIAYPHQVYDNYSNVTSSQFDRIASSVGHISLNPLSRPAFHPIVPQTYLSSVEEPRRAEFDRLKMRIAMLEQTQTQSDSIGYSGTLPVGNSEKTGMQNYLNHESGVMMHEAKRDIGAEELINSLERELNQKEYEIKELKKFHEGEINRNHEDIKQLQVKRTKVEYALEVEKNKCLKLEKEKRALEYKLEDRDEYIAKLPNLDEVNNMKEKVEEINNQNENLKGRIKELEKKVTRAKEYIKEKSNEVKQTQEKVDKLDQLHNKTLVEFDHYKRQTQNVNDLMQQCEENASIRAEFELAKKMIITLEEKERTTNLKHAQQLQEIREQAKLESDSNQAIRSELDAKEKALKNLTNSVRDISTQNQNLQHEKLALQENLRSFELMQSSDTTKLLHLLFVELSGCTNDLDCLVHNCVDIYEGKQIEITSLLGYGNVDYANPELADTMTQVTGLINNEYVLKRTKEIKRFREKLAGIRKVVSDQYADKLAMNMSCATQ